MGAPLLSLSQRVRPTPFSRRVESAGAKAYTTYNHMRLPSMFESVEADYHHLKRHVQVWDVACERQVEIAGPDAARLVRMLTPRSLAKAEVGQCLYTPMVDETGGMLNDPVTVMLAEDRYWVSIADSDLLFWVKGLAYGTGLDVNVFEPDVSPLGIQGPKADDLMARVFGEAVRGIKFFRFEKLAFGGHDFVIARSGYSKQGGFEIYVDGSDRGEPLWDALMAAGEDLEVRAGCPNLIERIEAGLLSYGSDMTRENTPHECGLGRFCRTVEAVDCVGRDALIAMLKDGPARQIRSLSIEGEPVPACTEWWDVTVDGEPAGRVASAVWSPDFQCNVALGMIERAHWEPGTQVTVEAPDGPRSAEIRDGSFI